MTAVPAAVRPRVAQLVRLFASPHDGEALGAVRAIGRTLTASGGSYADLADMIEREPPPRIVYRDRPEGAGPSVPPVWGNSGRHTVILKLERALNSDALTAWEREFSASILVQMSASRVWRPTAKQEQRLDELMAKLHARGLWV